MPQTSSFQTLKYEVDGTPYFEKVTETKVKDTETGIWNVDRAQTKVEKFTPESQGYLREIATSIVITRKAYGSDLKEITGFFQQKILMKVDVSQDDYKHAYLKKSTHTHSIMVTNFDSLYGCTQYVPLNDERFVHLIGKAKRISEIEAKRLLISHEAIALCDEVKNPETRKEEFRINV